MCATRDQPRLEFLSFHHLWIHSRHALNEENLPQRLWAAGCRRGGVVSVAANLDRVPSEGNSGKGSSLARALLADGRKGLMPLSGIETADSQRPKTRLKTTCDSCNARKRRTLTIAGEEHKESAAERFEILDHAKHFRRRTARPSRAVGLGGYHSVVIAKAGFTAALCLCVDDNHIECVTGVHRMIFVAKSQFRFGTDTADAAAATLGQR